MASLDLNEAESLALDQIRSELNRLLVQMNYFSSAEDYEQAIKKLLLQIDDIQYAYNISKRQEFLSLEPVNVNQVTENLLHNLSRNNRYAEINFQVNSKFTRPVLAHRQSLYKSLESMTHAVLDCGFTKKECVQFIVNLRGDEVKLGVFSKNFSMEAQHLRQFKTHVNVSSRPTSILSPFGLTNLFIANILLNAMNAPFTTAINQGTRGLATMLTLSRQLKFVSL